MRPRIGRGNIRELGHRRRGPKKQEESWRVRWEQSAPRIWHNTTAVCSAQQESERQALWVKQKPEINTSGRSRSLSSTGCRPARRALASHLPAVEVQGRNRWGRSKNRATTAGITTTSTADKQLQIVVVLI
eukprot:scaffold23032_cov20-Tisochrysis_lutea.AAC.1